MRCRECDYELWHCTGRLCPECGTPFSLRDYEFTQQRVLFHCPHCDHGVEGKGKYGWPDLTIEQCAHCGLATGLEYYIVRPVGESGSVVPDALPFRMEDGNWFIRYFKTVWLVMTKPTIAMRRIPNLEPLEKAWTFLITTLLITSAISMIPVLLFSAPLIGYGNTNVGPRIGSVLLFILVQFVIAFFLTLIFVFLWGLVTHFVLQLAGGTRYSFHRTMQACLYSSGSFVSSIVPCVGSILGIVWWFISAISMVSAGQGVSRTRASLAVLAMPLITTFCCCGGYFLLIQETLTPARAGIGQPQQPPQPPPSDQATVEDLELVEH